MMVVDPVKDLNKMKLLWLLLEQIGRGGRVVDVITERLRDYLSANHVKYDQEENGRVGGGDARTIEGNFRLSPQTIQDLCLAVVQGLRKLNSGHEAAA